jgi:hypothetical protein
MYSRGRMRFGRDEALERSMTRQEELAAIRDYIQSRGLTRSAPGAPRSCRQAREPFRDAVQPLLRTPRAAER